jgi:hypothetical protein
MLLLSYPELADCQRTSPIHNNQALPIPTLWTRGATWLILLLEITCQSLRKGYLFRISPHLEIK